MTDKRKVRRDLADVFCTTAEGVRGARAREWGLVDAVVKPQQFAEFVKRRAAGLAALSDRPRSAQGVALPPLERRVDDAGYHYRYVEVDINDGARHATITVSAPDSPQPRDLEEIAALGADWWPLRMARELDDAVLMLRANNLDIGIWLLKTRGDAERVLAVDGILAAHGGDWFVREVIGMLRRTLARLEVSSRTLFSFIERGSCFAGTLFELALAADRSYMQALEAQAPTIALTAMNFGAYPGVNRRSRLETRFSGNAALIAAVQGAAGRALPAAEALDLQLVTAAPDALDWNDEIRMVLEERASLSPDALTGMEANLRFGGGETLETRIFGRLSAWQNWVFSRPNAVGEAGALKVFGTGNKARFNWERV